MEGLVHPETGTPRMGPRERVRYVENNRSFGAFMLSDQIRDTTAEASRDIAAIAASLSPVSNREDRDGQHLKDSFEVLTHAGTLKVGGNLRVMVEVVNGARSAAPNEFGTSRNKRHRMLGRAGAAIGEFKPEGGLT